MAINLIATIEGALTFLASAQAWQETHVGGVWHIHIFTNNYTVVAGSTYASFTEASWPGYAAAAPTWAAAATISGVPTVVGPSVTFTQTSSFPSTNYGIYVSDAANAKLVGAANFAAPVVLTAAQPSHVVQINVTCKSEF